jgi:hypothetical protein
MPYAVGWCGDGGTHIRSVALPAGKYHGGRRGVIRGFSKASRRRLTDRLMRVPWRDVAQTDKHASQARAVLVTLTYPREFPQDARVYHRHLDNFHRSLSYVKQNRYGAIWRLEFQRRGAAHFHILFVFQEPVDIARYRVWCRRTWYRVVASGDPQHRVHGADVRAVYEKRSSAGALMRYLIKYLGKEDPEERESGRCWGCWGNLASEVRAAVVFVTYESWVEFCRRVRGWGKRSGFLRKVAEPWGIRLFTYGADWLMQMCAGIDGAQLFAGVPPDQ